MIKIDTREIIEVTVDTDKVSALMDYIVDMEDPTADELEDMDSFLTDYTEDMEDIDPNYPTTDELDDMDSFLTHYRAFVNKVDGPLSGSNTITLYGIYMARWSC